MPAVAVQRNDSLVGVEGTWEDKDGDGVWEDFSPQKERNTTG